MNLLISLLVSLILSLTGGQAVAPTTAPTQLEQTEQSVPADTPNKTVDETSKYGFDKVTTIDGKEYVSIVEISEKVKGLYFQPDIKNKTFTIKENDINGKILIENAPYIVIKNYGSVEYTYYLNTILPLSK